jgi:NADPH:quinone reductase-like Zn-dependent oxidoreductase
MYAIRFHTYGSPGVLRLEQVDRPVPGPGQVLVKVAGTSFNPVDAAFRAGHLQRVMPVALPHTPGVDLAGIVAELPDAPADTTGANGRPTHTTSHTTGHTSGIATGHTTGTIGTTGTAAERAGFSPGDAVIGFLPMTDPGAAAEFVLAPAGVLTAAPAGIPLADAAAVPAVALTAWQGLFEHAELRAGQRILVNGAGGGVGGYAVQFAKQAGATVVATAGPRSATAVRAAGADQIVDYTVTPVTDAVGEPVDAVFNLVAADEAVMTALVALIRPGGVLVSTASPAPEDAERKVRTTNMYVRSDAARLAEIVHRIDAGRVTVDISARHPLADLARVHELSAAGGIRGKVVLTV